MEFWVVDSDNLGPLKLNGLPDYVTVIAASNNRRLLPVIGGKTIGRQVPVWRQASDFRLIADTAVTLALSELPKKSILCVYTRDIGLAHGVRQLASQYRIKFQWRRSYDMGR